MPNPDEDQKNLIESEREIEEAWAAEVERRQAQVDSGEVSLLPGPETLAKLKAEFQD